MKAQKQISVKDIVKPRESHGFEYYFDEDLVKIFTPDELKKFEEWMFGQTCALLDGKSAVYYCDVSRFYNLIKYKTPTYWD